MKTIKRIFSIILIALIIAILYHYNAFDTIKNNIETLSNNRSNLASLVSDGSLISDKDLSNLEDSKITGEDYTFDTLYYPYYGMLNENEKKVYKQVYANALEVSSTFVPIVDITTNEVQNIIESIYNDHPELFFLDTNYNYKYLENGKCVQITLSFNKLADNIDENRNQIESIANNIINSANKLNSDYEKEKYVHDTLIKIIDYDTNALYNQSLYSALVNKKTVCAGYARSFQYIMQKLNIPTYFVVGYAKEDHGWNIVKLSDGYYNVDLTWDDNNSISYSYFNKTDSEFNKTHKKVGLSTNLPRCSATTYKYKQESNSVVKKEDNKNDSLKENEVLENSNIDDFSEEKLEEENIEEEISEEISEDNQEQSTTYRPRRHIQR